MEKVDWELTIRVWVLMALVIVFDVAVFVQLSEPNKALFALSILAVMCFLGIYLNTRERTLNERQYCKNRLRVAEQKAGITKKNN